MHLPSLIGHEVKKLLDSWPGKCDCSVPQRCEQHSCSAMFCYFEHAYGGARLTILLTQSASTAQSILKQCTGKSTTNTPSGPQSITSHSIASTDRGEFMEIET
mmetsp:Transcript_1771/g.2817  ORF Transcript_1771/g.2817 Transcript_1771/m.2817 type:complete len:103 (-) Transcript_1771:59-367(-)